MVSRKFVWAAAGVVAVALANVGTASAATILKSGDTVSGWKITFPAGIQLVSDGGNTVALEKFAAFTSTEGLAITFTQVDFSSSNTINILDEAVTNVSGSTFSSFQFLLTNEEAGGGSGASFNGSFFNNVGPFTNVTGNSNGSTSITLSGGPGLANFETADWGFGANGGTLGINANGATSGMKHVFTLKEIPGGGQMIPVPAAAWTGLSGLLGLGFISLGKKARKFLA